MELINKMPKVNYDKQPFRLCRWNKKFHTDDKSVISTFRGDINRPCEYYCDHGEELVDEEFCMKCFCNTWFNLCETCKKEILKTELIHVFLPEYKIGYICNSCYDDEERVWKEPSKTERYILSDIKNWQELNK